MVAPEEGREVIGQTVPWADYEGHMLLVTHFMPIATRDGNKVRSQRGVPYALLTVRDVLDEGLGAEMLLPVTHREDFKVLWWLFKESQLSELLSEQDDYVEVIVAYEAGGFLSSMRPKLHVQAYPAGWAKSWFQVRAKGGGYAAYEHTREYPRLFEHRAGAFDWNR